MSRTLLLALFLSVLLSPFLDPIPAAGQSDRPVVLSAGTHALTLP